MTPFGRQPVTAGLLAAQALSERASPCPVADKWQILRDLTCAREQFKVSDRDISVLSALLSFHPSQQLQDGQMLVVFPSNRSLSERAHGMAESTLRRHLTALIDAGLIIRRDSANGKRYSRKAVNGRSVAFGFDLRPLLVMSEEIAAAAEATRERMLQLRVKREELVIRLRDTRKILEWEQTQGLDRSCPLDLCVQLQTRLRRKPSPTLLEDIESDLEVLEAGVKAAKRQPTPVKLDGNDGQNGRHYQSSKTDLKESEEGYEDENLTLDQVLRAAPEVQNYASEDIHTWHDLVRLAWFVYPMLGITAEGWRYACDAMGDLHAAITVACMLERAGSIANPGAYLRKLSQKARMASFTPLPMTFALLRTNGEGACFESRKSRFSIGSS